MAASSMGRLVTLCRQFQRVVNISAPVQAQYSTHTLTRYQCFSKRQLCEPPWLSNTGNSAQCRLLHTSTIRMGLEEFFDIPENWGEPTVKSGAPWTAKQLRLKSNEDLHKLWYVLLKEKNMLLSIEQEAKRQRVQMPSPERIKKVERSMTRLDTVVQEREDALRLLQTGQEKARPGAWRKNMFGKNLWHRFKEYPIPWHLNKRYKRTSYFTPSFVSPYTRLFIEKQLKAKMRKQRRERQERQKLAKIFPKTSAHA
ncbi:large ribosomal subunit protein uL29m [Chanos chanos]|uniref:Large ribosomal subunit protein uL29m n=1 Tax=Chanos chanos TaxID=29144 RepID=A0A6J2WT36_CHACN|nr:39S ribosomal protein L47, mitochondrial [Chanos chanos]